MLSGIDKEEPCICPVALPGPSDQSPLFGNVLGTTNDGSILIVASSSFHMDFSQRAGAVFVFERPNNFGSCMNPELPKYALVQILTVPEEDQQNNPFFGTNSAISADGRRIVVSAPLLNTVYVYDRKRISRSRAPEWVLVQKVIPQRFDEDCCVVDDFPVEFNNFGVILALSKDGRVLVVGYRIDNDFEHTGHVYIYDNRCANEFDSTNGYGLCLKPFKFVQKITNEELSNSPEPSLIAGVCPTSLSVDASGERIFVGVANGSPSSGAVEVFRRCDHKTVWKLSQTLLPPLDILPNTRFFGICTAVTPCGQYLVIETAESDSNGNEPYLSFYQEVFENGCAKYAQDGAIISGLPGKDNTSKPQQIGISNDGCLVVAGWQGTTVSGDFNAGEAIVYERICNKKGLVAVDEPAFVLKQEIFPNPVAPGASFSVAIALSGDGLHLAINDGDTKVDVFDTFSIRRL